MSYNRPRRCMISATLGRVLFEFKQPLAKASVSDTPEAVETSRRSPLQRLDYQQQLAAIAPSVPGERSPLTSSALQAVPVFHQVMKGALLLTMGTPYQEATFAVQQLLNTMGFDCGTPDGIWGPRTNGGVKAFQSDRGLSVDGIVGPNTLAAIDQTAGSAGALNTFDDDVGSTKAISETGGRTEGSAKDDSGHADLTVESVEPQGDIMAVLRPFRVEATVANVGAVAAKPVGARIRLFGTNSRQNHPIVQGWKNFGKIAPGAKKKRTITIERVPEDAPTRLRDSDVLVGVNANFGRAVDDPNVQNDMKWSQRPVKLVSFYGNGNADPRFGYTDEAKESSKKLDEQRLPYTSSVLGSDWNYKEILNTWTQIDGYDELNTVVNTDTDEFRCGPTAVMAASIMAGPRGVVRFAENVQKAAAAKQARLQKRVKAGDPEALKRFAEITVADLRLSLARVNLSFDFATYGTLSIIAHSAKMVLTSSASQQTTATDMPHMAGHAGKTTDYKAEEKRLWSSDQLETMIEGLAPGEAYLVLVDTDMQLQRTQRSDKYLNHWVTLGAEKDSPTDRPQVFLYDPYPRQAPDGSKRKQYYQRGEGGFDTYFKNADGSWRSAMIGAKVDARK